MKHDLKVFGAPGWEQAVCENCDTVQFVFDSPTNEECPGIVEKHPNRDQLRTHQDVYQSVLKRHRVARFKESFAREAASAAVADAIKKSMAPVASTA